MLRKDRSNASILRCLADLEQQASRMTDDIPQGVSIRQWATKHRSNLLTSLRIPRTDDSDILMTVAAGEGGLAYLNEQ